MLAMQFAWSTAASSYESRGTFERDEHRGFTFEEVEGPDDLSVPVTVMLEEKEPHPQSRPIQRVNQRAPGERMAFECGRFDMGHHCSAEEDKEMEVAEQCGEHTPDAPEEIAKGTFIGCCRQVRINFLNQNFKSTPVIVISVLRPAELAHATFSTTVRRKGDEREGFTVQLTREDECACGEKGDCHSWCAPVEVLWMAYGLANRNTGLGTGHYLGEYKHPYGAAAAPTLAPAHTTRQAPYYK